VAEARLVAAAAATSSKYSENRGAAQIMDGLGPQIVMRNADGWRSVAEKPADKVIDIAAYAAKRPAPSRL